MDEVLRMIFVRAVCPTAADSINREEQSVGANLPVDRPWAYSRPIDLFWPLHAEKPLQIGY